MQQICFQFGRAREVRLDSQLRDGLMQTLMPRVFKNHDDASVVTP